MNPRPFVKGDRVVLVADDTQLKWLVTGLTGTVLQGNDVLLDLDWVLVNLDVGTVPGGGYAVATLSLGLLPTEGDP